MKSETGVQLTPELRNAMREFLFSLLFLIGILAQPSFADTNDDSADGNLIPEPALADYINASRAPGILSQAFDLTDENGDPVEE